MSLSAGIQSKSTFGQESATDAEHHCILESKLNAPLFVSILKRCIVPFLQAVYLDGHRFVQANDPKQSSNYARRFYEKGGPFGGPLLHIYVYT